MKTRLPPTFGLLVLVVAGGTAGYMLVEGWSFWDALYMTVTTVATSGTEVYPLSPAGQAFTLLLIVVGVSAALDAFPALAAVVVEGGWPKYLEQWRYLRMIDHLQASSDNLELSIEQIHIEKSSPLDDRPLSEVTQRDKVIVLGSSQPLKELERAAR